ncbi:hypothetical protein CSV79_10925 [Sporosarcina sp. P13]|nr:hypothetical protein CSV79_10925 [Sporosarcina sp. P13]
MTDRSAMKTIEDLEQLHTLYPTLDCHLFVTLSFLSLPVIPELKRTDTGLFDVNLFRQIPIQADSMK